jgi:hypothetical protein
MSLPGLTGNQVPRSIFTGSVVPGDDMEACVKLSEKHSKTNHEQTLSVPYVFRNHLISGEEVEGPFKPRANAPI